jgi:hypothetical protein
MSEDPRLLTDPNATLRDLNASWSNSNASFRDLNVSLSNPSPHELNTAVTGFYFTAYVTGFGDSNHDSRSQWAIAISLLQHALMQLSRL